jgi:phospholipid-binding lipoprotein MlaA
MNRTVSQRATTRTQLSLLLLVIFLAGCASRNGSEKPHNPDPFEPVNRVTFKFNDVADTYVLRPIAKGYQTITPSVVRTGINNFFENLGYPIDIVNAFLQGKFKQGFSDTGRFLMNTTLGLAGFLDPATDAGLVKHNEDFGQTLGVWGVPKGPYLVVPFFGPRTVRSGAGNLVDIQYAPQFNGLFSSSVQTKVNLFWFVHERSTLLGVDEEINRAFDKYAFLRDAYLQNRRYLRYDGNLPDDELGDGFDDGFDDEFEEEFE